MRPTLDPLARTLSVLAERGFTPATDAEIEAGRAAAAALVGEAIASAETMRRVQARTGGACFVLKRDGAIIAALSAIPLTPAALPGLTQGLFDAISPQDTLIARPQDPVAAIYLWGGAGMTPRGRMQAVTGAIALREEAHPHMPFYARAATSDGERVLQTRLGARPGPGDLAVALPYRPQTRAA